MAFKLLSISDETVEDIYKIYQAWLRFHNRNSVESQDSVQHTKMNKSPEYFNRTKNSNFKFGFYKDSELLALMCIDDSNAPDPSNIATIDDVLFSPESDWSEVLFNLVLYYQKRGYGALNLDARLMDHHKWFQTKLAEYGGLQLPITHRNSDGSKQVNYKTVIPFFNNTATKWDLDIIIKVNGSVYTTKGTIYKSKQEYSRRRTSFFHDPGMQKISIRTLVLKDQVLNIPPYDDQLFEIQINGREYNTSCECAYEWCEHRRNCRFNKLRTDYIGKYDVELEKTYYLINSIDVPDPSIECTDDCIFHPVEHSFSRFLSQFPCTQKHKKMVPVEFVQPDKCIPANSSSSYITDISILYPESPWPEIVIEDSVDCDETEFEGKVGYQYLIWEREYFQKNETVLKHGKTVQEPNNKIKRLQGGYKKGSKIMLVIECCAKNTHAIETEINTEFRKKFTKHDDGNEYFSGNPDEMKDTMWEIVKKWRGK